MKRQPSQSNLYFSRYSAIAIVLSAFALFLRLQALDAHTYFGDEFSTLDEFRQIGLNLNSLPYFLMLNLWGRLGNNEFWYRFPAVLFGVLTVPTFYRLGREGAGARVGIAMAALAAVSPYIVGESQQVRFYTLFLLASTITYILFLRVLRGDRSRFTLLAFLAANLLTVSSHLMGVFVVLVELVVFFLWAGGARGFWKRGFVAAIATLVVVLIVSLPPVRAWGFDFLQRYAHGIGHYDYTEGKGLGFVNFAKIAISLFIFTFGEYVYPLTWGLVLPGGLALGFLAAHGVWNLWRNRDGVMALLLGVGLAPLAFLFLVLDAVAPFPTTVSFRYAIFTLPLLFLLLACGVRGLGRVLTPIATVLGIVMLISTWNVWYGDWSMNDSAVNWRAAVNFVRESVKPGTVVLYDGRSADYVNHYMSNLAPTLSQWSPDESEGLRSIEPFDRVIFLSNDWQASRRQAGDRLLDQLTTKYAASVARVDYPLFAMVYDKQPADVTGFPVDANGVVAVPREILGLEFQDLKLPTTAQVDSMTLPIYGAFSISPGQSRALPVGNARLSRGLIIITQLLHANKIADGVPVVEITIHSADGSSQQFLLRQGSETDDWAAACDKCRVAFTWHKRAAMLGAAAYPGAWSDFQAQAFIGRFDFTMPTAAQNISLRYLPTQGTLYVWQLEFIR